MLRNVVIGVALVASASTALPSAAMAKDHGHKHGHHGRHHHGDDDDRGRRYDGDRRYYSDRYAEPRRYYSDNQPSYRCGKTGGTTGLIIGGAAGALLGRAIDTRGERTTGTILGAGAGALLGREVAQKRRC
jgi:hypothetical protein